MNKKSADFLDVLKNKIIENGNYSLNISKRVSQSEINNSDLHASFLHNSSKINQVV